MKIDIVTFSCDSTPIYSDFWNPISKFWRTKFGIHPVLLYCGNNHIDLSEEYGTVHRVPSVNGVADYHSATWGRFWITKKYPDAVCLTGDIDMIPLSKRFFLDGVEQFTEDSYIHLNSGWYYGNDTTAWKKEFNIISAYYHLATGKMFQDVYGFEDNFADEMRKFESGDYNGKNKGVGVGYAPLRDVASHLKHASSEMGGKWGQDELYSTDLMRKYLSRGGKIVTDTKIDRSQRIDRSHWQYYPQAVFEDAHYVDSHLLRPYSGDAKKHIDFLMHLVP